MRKRDLFNLVKFIVVKKIFQIRKKIKNIAMFRLFLQLPRRSADIKIDRPFTKSYKKNYTSNCEMQFLSPGNFPSGQHKQAMKS